jgi:hypothetical protein
MCILPGEWHFKDLLVLALLPASTAFSLPSPLVGFHIAAF